MDHITYEDFRNAGMMDISITKKYLEEQKIRKCVVIIDEAQRYFAQLRDNQEYYFFEYSRHVGLDIFLIVQSVTTLPKRLVELSEFVIEAQPRNIQTTGFSYIVRDSKTGSKLSTQGVKRDNHVFSMYKSFDIDESAKPPRTQIKKLAIGAAVIIGVLIGAKYALSYAFHADMTKARSVQTQQPRAFKAAKIRSTEKKISGDDLFDESGQMEFNGITRSKVGKKISGIITVTNKDGSTRSILIKREKDPDPKRPRGGSERGRVFGESAKNDEKEIDINDGFDIDG